MILSRLSKFVILIVLTLTLWQCAQIGSLGGGPKDEVPPQVLKTEPANGSPNFAETGFTVYFNEFIQLDGINQKVMISPPLEKMPDFKEKGKSLQIKFNEELKENTTYSVYFGDAIVDLTERNALLNFTYIFSTGPTVDSMSMAGTVINAFNLETVEETYVLLYKDNNDTLPLDSLPLSVKPYYVSKTDENGRYQFNGLGNSSYLVFGLKDLNTNYIYDQPGEEIAFLDSLIYPQYINPPEVDSAMLDSLLLQEQESQKTKISDEVKDSLVKVKRYETFVKMINYELFLFDEVDTVQRLLKASLERENTIRYSFSRPVKDVVFDVKNVDTDTSWYIEEISRDKDTLWWYFRDLPFDTLEVAVMHRGDTLGYEYIRINPKKSIPGIPDRRKKKEEVEKQYVGYSSNIGGKKLPLNKQPHLTFHQPIKEVIIDSILLVKGGDSLYSPEFQFLDSLNRSIRFPLKVEESTKYSLSFPDSAFIDWNNRHNKAGIILFNTASLREYGILNLSLKPEKQQPYILQLMTSKESLNSEYYFQNDTSITIEYLDPGKYILKLMFDDNGNKKWDPGNYLEKKQPERVIYYQKELEVRGNWEIEETWIIEE